MSEVGTIEGSPDFTERALRACLETFPRVRLTVTGECMRPTLVAGAAVLLASALRRPPRWGDIVLTCQAGTLRLHRVVWHGRARASLRTKADRSPSLDPRLLPQQVLGTVVALETDGRAVPVRGRVWLTARSIVCALLVRARRALRQLARGLPPPEPPDSKRKDC